MTELEWFSCTNPHEMLPFLKEKRASGLTSLLARIGLRKGEVSTRKLLLFACACLRRIWPLLSDDSSRQAIEATELYADGAIGKRAFHQAVQAARTGALDVVTPSNMACGRLVAAQARAREVIACSLEAEDPADEAATWGKEIIRAWASQSANVRSSNSVRMPLLPHHTMGAEAAWIAEGIAQCELLRDLFGNPYRPPASEAALRSAAVVAQASAIYQARAFAKLPDLADTLEKTGCKNSAILLHCRDKKEHVYGCWVLDLVLGKG